MLDGKKWERFIKNIRQYRLGNGLKVAVYPDRRLPEAAVSLVYHIGSKDEKNGEKGYAHLFEHLMFEGSENSRMDYFMALEKYGATINGGTSEDKTMYWEVVPSVALNRVLWLESDRLRTLFPYIDEERLGNQKEVVKNERRQVLESEPYGISEELLPELVFPEGHPYRHPVIGYAEDIDSATISKMKSFFDRFYVPRNASLSIAGDVDPEKAMELAEKYFGMLPGGRFSPPPAENVPLLKSPRRTSAADNVKLRKVYYAWPTPSLFSKEDRAFQLAAACLARGSDSPLTKRLTIDEALCQSISVSQWSGEVCGLFSVVVTLIDPDNKEKAEKIIFEELAKLMKDGPEENELKSIVRRIEARTVKGLENLGGFGGVAGSIGMGNLIFGEPEYFVRDLENYAAVGPSDIAGALGRWAPVDLRAELDIFPGKDVAITAFEKPAVSIPEKFEFPKPAVSMLDSGMEVWTVGEKAVPYTTFGLYLKAGASYDPTELPGLAQLTGQLLDEGAAGLSNIEISKKLKEIAATYDCEAKYNYLSFSIEAPSEFREEALQLLADIFLKPDFPEKEIERLKKIKVSSIKKIATSVDELGARVERCLLFGKDSPFGHPVSGRVSSVERIGKEDITGFYRKHFAPQRAAMIAAGDLGEGLPEKIGGLFGSFRTGESADAVEPVPVSDPSSLYLLRMRGVTSTYVSAFFHSVPRSDPRYPALSVFNSILGGKFSSRLMKKMREEKGYTYGVHSYFTLQKGAMPWMVEAMVEKGKEREAVEDIRSELERIVGENPPTEKEFREAKEGFLLRYFQNFETQQDLVDDFGRIFAMSLPLSFYEDTVNLVGKTTLEEVTNFAKEVYSPEKLTFLVVGDHGECVAKLPFKKIVELNGEDFI